SFPMPFGINTQFNGFYFGPRANAQTESKGIVTFSGALNKPMLNDKATLSFRVSDILNSSKRKSTTETADFRNYTEFQWRQPTYIFTFTYRVNERKMDRRRNNSRQNFGDGDEQPDF
ncbi:MAG: outer membrane beta-barrel protein, partial [Flavobacteriaceae bacterium]